MQIRRVFAMAAVAVAPFSLAAQNIPGIDVQVSPAATELAQGASVQAKIMADPQAYVIVFRVTTDNRIVVIYPRTPDGGKQIRSNGAQPGERDVGFRTDPFNGVGHVFAAASYTPFDFSKVRVGVNWDIEKLDDTPDGNPQEVANWFLEQVVPSARTPFSVNAAPYYVGVAPSADSTDMDNSGQVADQSGGGGNAGPPQYPQTPGYAPDTLADTTGNPDMAGAPGYYPAPGYDAPSYSPGGFGIYPTFYFSAGWGGYPSIWYGPRVVGPHPRYIYNGYGYYPGGCAYHRCGGVVHRVYGRSPQNVGRQYPAGRVGGRYPAPGRYPQGVRMQRSAPAAAGRSHP